MNESTGFYKHWSVETDIRSIAFNFPNVYQVAFFACGRELWNINDHIGCFASKEAAEQHYEAKKLAEEAGEVENEDEVNCKIYKQIASIEKERMGKLRKFKI